jgi:hypothetical protein
MDFKTLMQDASKILDGTFSEYDDKTTVIIVPVDDHRFQTVFAHNEDEDGIKFNSKACDPTDELPFKKLIDDNSNHKYARLEIENDVLYVTSRSLPGSQPEGVAKMLLEVGKVADSWELELTGQDIN